LSASAGDGFIAEGLGETIIDLTDEDDTVEWVLMDGHYADFVMGADITWGPVAEEDTCGFIFRRVDEDNYYVIEIDRTGTVWFVERENGEWGDSEGDSYLAVRTGAKDDNQLVLSVSGGTFIVYVNGQRTATFSDNSNASGETAVEMTTYDESTITNCTFNHVWVWDLGQAAFALPTATPGSLPTLPGANMPPTKTPVPSSNLPTGATVTITVPSANLRSGPGTDYERVESAVQGDSFGVIAQAGSGADTWYLVSIPGNRQGWLWSGIVSLSPANAVIPLAEDVGVVSSGGQPPVINSIVSQGPCDDITFVVDWSDADGDAAQIEWLDTDTGEIVFTDDISGSGGNFSSPDWFCESATCTTNAQVRDVAGNVSSIYEVTTVCS
jgi:uncharacterized protein YgiM (DUF1202 family)